MSEDAQHKKIFVGGLGRSGTTIMAQLLGQHNDIFGLGWETRFIVDIDGLGELVDGLSVNWAGPVTGGEKVRRFRRMMTRDLVERDVAPYEGYSMYDYFDPEHYDTTVRTFLDGLVDAEWPAFSIQSRRSLSIVTQQDGEDVTIEVRTGERSRILPQYLEREKAAQYAGEFVDRLFGGAGRAQGKQHWCEKTPHNILSPYPKLLFPDSYIVHMIRDPRDVVASIGSGKHNWGGPDARMATKWAEGFYKKWLDIADQYRGDERYIEIFFEDFIDDPAKTLTYLCGRLGVEPEAAMWDADLSKHNIGRHRTELSDEDVRRIERDVVPLASRAGFHRYE
ncbi:sulfotransferase [Streptomyces sp. col6]|uniref:sulfotransferase family protein n=1 Tax=Streptomyces sp. col6 TaxID=2478958 RepID=UPI0011CE6040|nr:sulfotransferase [Streptomyces sp. col6]TXS05054.1 sulfotransferase [Streptomyces sp. col6]